MTDTASSFPTDPLKNSLEELRASVAGQGTNKGLAGVLQEVMLGILNLLMTLLADFRAGKLVPSAPGAREERGSGSGVDAASHTSPQPPGQARGRLSPQSREGANGTGGASWFGLWGRSPQRGEGACAADGAVAHPSACRIGPHFCLQKRKPVARRSHSLGRRGIVCDESPRFRDAIAEAEDDPALFRARGAWISPPANAAGGGIRAARVRF
jgi:hypothetical protein